MLILQRMHAELWRDIICKWYPSLGITKVHCNALGITKSQCNALSNIILVTFTSIYHVLKFQIPYFLFPYFRVLSIVHGNFFHFFHTPLFHLFHIPLFGFMKVHRNTFLVTLTSIYVHHHKDDWPAYLFLL